MLLKEEMNGGFLRKENYLKIIECTMTFLKLPLSESPQVNIYVFNYHSLLAL